MVFIASNWIARASTIIYLKSSQEKRLRWPLNVEIWKIIAKLVLMSIHCTRIIRFRVQIEIGVIVALVFYFPPGFRVDQIQNTLRQVAKRLALLPTLSGSNWSIAAKLTAELGWTRHNTNTFASFVCISARRKFYQCVNSFAIYISRSLLTASSR